MPRNSDPDDRIAWMDAARGIGIVLIVVGHVQRGLVLADIAHGAVWSWMDYGLYTFHIPLFFLLAGLNVPASLAMGKRRFIVAKLWNIAWPYLLWSVIQGSILIILSSYTNGHATISDLLSIAWHPMAQFWFLYVLMACQLAAVVLATRPVWLAAAAGVAFAGGASLAQGSLPEDFLHSFPFFALGILLSERLTAWPSGYRTAFLAACCLAAAIGVSGPLDGMNFDAALALPAAVAGIVFVVAVARLLRGVVLDVASMLGRLSMSIYVMHILAAAGARIVLARLHILPNPWLYLAVCTLIGVAAPIVAHRVMDRFGLLGAFGLRAGGRARPRPKAAISIPMQAVTDLPGA